MKFDSSYFGHIVVDPQNSTYIKSHVLVNGRSSDCSLYIDKNVDVDQELSNAILLVERLPELDKIARNYFEKIQHDPADIVAEYIDFHLEQALDEIQEKLGVSKPETSVLVKNLELCAVAVHGDSDHFHLVCDYSIGQEFVDAVLAVIFNHQGELLGVEWES